MIIKGLGIYILQSCPLAAMPANGPEMPSFSAYLISFTSMRGTCPGHRQQISIRCVPSFKSLLALHICTSLSQFSLQSTKGISIHFKSALPSSGVGTETQERRHLFKSKKGLFLSYVLLEN